MPDAISRARDALDERRRELASELKQIERALGSLPDRVRPSRRRSSKAARVVRRSPRGDQFLKAVRGKPGMGTSEIAKKLGISPQQASGVAARLKKQGRLRKKDRGWHLGRS